MTEETTLNEREKLLATLLQVSLDFAFGRMSEGKRLIPFAGRVGTSGAIDLFRVAGDETDTPLDELHQRVISAMAEQADANALNAVALVAPIQGEESILGAGFFQAIRVHLEMPGYSRVIFQPFRIDAGGKDEKSQLALGNMVAAAEEHVVFGEEMTSNFGGATIFNLT